MEQKVGGYVGASNIKFATLQATPIDNKGQPSIEVNQAGRVVYIGDKTTSAETSFFRVNVDEKILGKPMLIVATSPDDKAAMRCERVTGCSGIAYKGDIKLDKEFEYRLLVADAVEDMSANINWLTHIASAYAYASYIDTTDDGVNNPNTLRPGMYSRYSIDLANRRLSQIFGLSDIISIQPIAPSTIASSDTLPLAMQQESILYGAILTSIQVLKPADDSFKKYLNGIIKEFNTRKGQWLQKNTRASSSVALFDIYKAAEQVLNENIDFLRATKTNVPVAALNAMDELKQRQQTLKEGQLTNYPAPVLSKKAQDEINAIQEAKGFIKDLNQRFLNFDGSRPGAGFVEREYAQKVTSYIKDLRSGYRKVSPTLRKTVINVKDAFAYYASVLHGQADTQNPILENSTVDVLRNFTLPDKNALKDETGSSTKLRITTGSNRQLFLSFTGNKNTPRKPPEGKFFLFRIYLEGEFEQDGKPVSFSSGKGSDGKTTKPYLDVEYATARTTPAPVTVEEPLTYKLVWPEVSWNIQGQRTHDVKMAYEAELVGIRDPLKSATDVNNEFRYNLKSAVIKLTNTGPKSGDEADISEAIVTLQTSQWQLFYPSRKWPVEDDFFVAREGFEAGTVDDDLFEYFVSQETVTENSQSKLVDFIDIGTVTDSGQTVLASRYRILAIDGESNEFFMQRCNVAVESGKRTVGSCNNKIRVKGKPTIDSMVSILPDRLLSVVPSRGAYQIQLPKETVVENGKSVTRLKPLILNTGVKVPGKLVKQIVQGVNKATIRVAADILEKVSGREKEHIGLAELIINAQKLGSGIFDIAVNFAYKYQPSAFIGTTLRGGKDAQSFRIAYRSGLASNGPNEEIGSLLVYRGNVVLAGKDAAVPVGLFAISEVNYEAANATDKVVSPCSVVNRKIKMKSCDAIAYLGYRGTLLAAVREERKGVFVARFINGDFVILGK